MTAAFYTNFLHEAIVFKLTTNSLEILASRFDIGIYFAMPLKGVKSWRMGVFFKFSEWNLKKKLAADVRKQFNNATYLYSTWNDVNDLNLAELQALNQPCAHTNASHDGGSDAAKAPADKAGGLELELGPCVFLGNNDYQKYLARSRYVIIILADPTLNSYTST